jgi:protein-tyrosine phosphatase
MRRWRSWLSRTRDGSAVVGVEFVRFAFENFAVPPFEPDTVLFIRALAEQLRRGRGVVLHCQTGVGRTGLMAASVLVTEEWTSDKAIQAVAKARRRPVPDNDLQSKFVELLATLDFSCPPGQERRKAYAF